MNSLNRKKQRKILVELSKLTPTDIKVWKSLTYLQIRLEKREEALQSLRQARNLAPQDDTLKLQEAYLLNQQKKDREALVLFKELSSLQTLKLLLKHLRQLKNLSGEKLNHILEIFILHRLMSHVMTM